MILVIVGQLHLNFDRLLIKMDQIASELDEKIIMQTGSSEYIPKNVEYFNFESEETMERLYDDCSLLVCHAGAGTILNGLIRKKPIVMVPRREKYNEATNDHQLEITEKMTDRGNGLAVYEINDLLPTILKAKSQYITVHEKDSELTSYLSKRFEELNTR